MNPLAHLRRNLIAYVALFCALSAGAYAAGLKKNSVGSKQIKTAAVKTDEIADGAVTGAKLAEGTLAQVPSAAQADKATTATNAENAVNATNAVSAQNAANAQNAVSAQHADTAGDATTVSGQSVKSFSATQPGSTAVTEVARVGGLSLSLECDGGADTEVTVRTASDNASLQSVGEYSTASTTRVVANDDDFDSTETIAIIPHAAQAGNIIGELRYLAANGKVVTVNYATDSSAAGECQLWGTAIGS